MSSSIASIASISFESGYKLEFHFDLTCSSSSSLILLTSIFTQIQGNIIKILVESLFYFIF